MKHLLTYNLFEKISSDPREISPKELEKRWEKKRKSIKELQKNIIRLRQGVSKDMGSDDEKTKIIATIVRIIDKTGERVGNEVSKLNGHHGITNLKSKHIKINGDKVTLNYTGKSGVDHSVTFNDRKVANVLENLKKVNKDEIFVTSYGLSVKAPQINKYLSDFNITSKDLRGYKCNKLMSDKLRSIKKPKTEQEIKKVFNEVLKEVADIIGHTPATLRKNYLLPEIEEDFYNNRKVQKI
ncbi:MAG: hypothetical protein ACOC3V_01090 [bacterium]